jgi:hypothetical protein
MSRTVNRGVGSFKASRPDGSETMVLVFQQFIVADNTLDGSRSESAGMKSLKLSTGQNVSKVSDGQYEVTSLGITLTSTDPNRI